MYNREQMHVDKLVKQGINLATLKKADLPCVVCGQLTLKVISKWSACDGSVSTSFVCTDKWCKVQYSLAR